MYPPPKIDPPDAVPLRRRASPLRHIGRIALKAVRPALKRHGLGEAALIEAWPEIVGESFAGRTFPIHLNRRSQTLTLRVAGSFALEIQHLEPQILERIATYCGSALVRRLKIVQGPLPKKASPNAPPGPLSAAQEARLEKATNGIHSPALKAALVELGRRITAR